MAVVAAVGGFVDESFAVWVDDELAEVKRCLQCGTCSSHCPLAAEMDGGPRNVMALARRGDRESALSGSTIWLCTSCYSCTVACPREIPVTDVMYALKRRAMRDGVLPRRREMPALADEFGAMVRRSGRITESHLLMRIFLRAGPHRMLRFFGLGARLFRRGRVGVGRERISHRSDLSRLLDAAATEQEPSS